jgi:GTP cyclohydrolase I
MATDRNAAEQAILAFLRALGHDPREDPELVGTPARVTEAFERELLAGYAVDVAALISAESTPLQAVGPRGLVVARDIDVHTICPHHLLPGSGRAKVAYLPGTRLVGIGTLARVVDAYARRLSLQETIGEGVVRALMDHAGARGAVCLLEMRHTCLAARGARQSEASILTVARGGDDIDPAYLGRGDP